MVIGSSYNVDMCQVFKAYLAEIGIDMEINLVESTVFYDYVNVKRMHDQIAWEYNCANWDFSPFRCFTLFYSENVRDNQNIKDPVYDEMYLREVIAEGEEVSPAEVESRLVSKAKELDMYVVSHYWTVPGVPAFSFTLWQPWLKGYSGEGPRFAFQTYARWWIDQDVKEAMGY